MKLYSLKKRLLLILTDHILILAAFWLVSIARGSDLISTITHTHPRLVIFLVLHFGVAMWFDKYFLWKHAHSSKTYRPMIYTSLAFTGIASFLIVVTSQFGIPRLLFFGTVALATAFEFPVWSAIHLFNAAKRKGFSYNYNGIPEVKEKTPEAAPAKTTKNEPHRFLTIQGHAIRQSILYETGPNALEYLKENVPLDESSVVLSVNNRLNILNLPSRCVDTIVNLQRVNNHRRINKFFEAVNFKLPPGGIYSGVAEPLKARKKRFLRKYTPVFGIVLYSFDFLWNRIAPKIPVLKKVYFGLTKGRNRVMSRAEVLGRLYACGFDIIDETQVDELLFFTARKVRNPHYDNNPTYGPLICLRRVGKDGKIIGVYKMRTMHPFAEYLQPYIHKKNNLQEGGKFGNDFRISTCGKIMRKLWIDELPMLYNWVNGDLKLVGVRPLSEHFFNLYDEELQEKRTKVKPGLVPPFYADMPTTLEEIQESESRYIDAYLKAPLTTDWKYFWKAFNNIVFKNARSS